jgi:hypothetical protein
MGAGSGGHRDLGSLPESVLAASCLEEPLAFLICPWWGSVRPVRHSRMRLSSRPNGFVCIARQVVLGAPWMGVVGASRGNWIARKL